MSDPSAAMQAAVYAALTGSAAVQAAMGGTARVYDKLPNDTPTYPFIRIGDDQSIDDGNGCGDAWEMFVTVHIYSNKANAPRPEVKAIGAAVRAAMVNESTPLAPTGFAMTLAEFQTFRTFMDDNVTCHGVLTCRYLIDAQA